MTILKPNLQIAIDGPVAAGKGTVSKLLAEKLSIIYVDTGAMYRAITYYIKNQNVDFKDEQQISSILKEDKPKVMLERPDKQKKDGRLVTVYLNNKDVSWKIRTPDIDKGVSTITQYKDVRNYMVPQQRNLANSTSVIMEGRDITTRVLPDADLKIYMDGSIETRAKRRYEQTLKKGIYTSYKEVLSQLKQRDYQDSHRDIDPLHVAEDAWVLDTTHLSIDEVIQSIIDKLSEKKLLIP